MLKGNSLISAFGYQERTMRQSMAKEKKFKEGPSTKESGCTQASVSESMSDEDAIMPTAASVSITPSPRLLNATSIASNGDACRGPIVNDADAAGSAARPAC
eukprot:34353_1